LSVIAILAVLAPTAEGVNVTEIEQFAPAMSVVGEEGQVLPVTEKSPAFAPARANPLNVTGEFPVLEIVTPCAALVVLKFWAANVRLAGLNPRV
jgi:hypothetical protein